MLTLERISSKVTDLMTLADVWTVFCMASPFVTNMITSAMDTLGTIPNLLTLAYPCTVFSTAEAGDHKPADLCSSIDPDQNGWGSVTRVGIKDLT